MYYQLKLANSNPHTPMKSVLFNLAIEVAFTYIFFQRWAETVRSYYQEIAVSTD